jgi:two-component system chemotaxis response regulator CheY
MREILIVDDAAIVCRVASQIFENFHMRPYEARDAAAALEICARRMPDIVLLDMHMPETDSFELLATLRGMAGSENAFMISCFVANSPELVARALSAGANGVMLKPFDEPIMKAKFVDMGLL